MAIRDVGLGIILLASYVCTTVPAHEWSDGPLVDLPLTVSKPMPFQFTAREDTIYRAGVFLEHPAMGTGARAKPRADDAPNHDSLAFTCEVWNGNNWTKPLTETVPNATHRTRSQLQPQHMSFAEGCAHVSGGFPVRAGVTYTARITVSKGQKLLQGSDVRLRLYLDQQQNYEDYVKSVIVRLTGLVIGIPGMLLIFCDHSRLPLRGWLRRKQWP